MKAETLVNRSAPPGIITPELGYTDVLAAAKWLCAAFGFVERLRIGTHRVQLVFNGASVVVMEAKTAGGTGTSVLVRVTDANAHYEIAKATGAKIIRPPTDYPYGERQYTAEDFAGYQWRFTQSIADVNPADWGGELL